MEKEKKTETYQLPLSPPEAHYTVYCLVDPDGKIYVGCTGKPVEKRWRKGWHYNNRTQIYKAIRKLGWENFEKLVLCENLTREGAEKLEKWFIAYYDSSDPEKGYNRTLGGLGKGVRLSETTKSVCSQSKKLLYTEDLGYRERVSAGILEAYKRDPSLRVRISESAKKHWQDPEYRAKVVAGKIKAFENPELSRKASFLKKQYYKEHPEKTEEISLWMKEYLSKPGNRAFIESDRHPKPVICVETGVLYPSQHAAEKRTGIRSIHKACSGSNRTAGGYHWRRLQESQLNSVEVF